MDASIIGRRPKTSARRPEKGRIAVLARPYADPIHTKSSPPWRSLVIVGTAVDTAVMSSALRKLATTTAMKDSQNAEPFFPELGDDVAGEVMVERGRAGRGEAGR